LKFLVQVFGNLKCVSKSVIVTQVASLSKQARNCLSAYEMLKGLQHTSYKNYKISVSVF